MAVFFRQVTTQEIVEHIAMRLTDCLWQTSSTRGVQYEYVSIIVCDVVPIYVYTGSIQISNIQELSVRCRRFDGKVVMLSVGKKRMRFLG